MRLLHSPPPVLLPLSHRPLIFKLRLLTSHEVLACLMSKRMIVYLDADDFTRLSLQLQD